MNSIFMYLQILITSETIEFSILAEHRLYVDDFGYFSLFIFYTELLDAGGAAASLCKNNKLSVCVCVCC